MSLYTCATSRDFLQAKLGSKTETELIEICREIFGFAVRLSSFAVRLLSFALRLTSFAVRLQSSAVRFLIFL